MEEALAIGLIIGIVVFYLVLFGILIADYIMSSMAVQTIAKRRQIPSPWLAWIPIASNWILGCIAEDYDERNGIKRKWSKALLILAIAFVAAIIFMYIAIFVFAFYVGLKYGDGLAEPPMDEAAVIFVLYFVTIMLATLVASVYQVCTYICYYKLFESTVPEKALKYMILSVLVPLAGPICLLKCKDKGYSKPEFAEPILQPEIISTENNEQ